MKSANTEVFVTSVLIHLIALSCVALGGPPAHNAPLSVLKELNPLPKKLMAWGQSYFESAAVLEEWVRITGACPITLLWASDERIRECATVLVKYPTANLAVTYSPLVKQYNLVTIHAKPDPIPRHSPAGRRATMQVMLDVAETGGVWDREKARVLERLALIDSIFASEGIDLSDPARAPVMMLDHEYAVVTDTTRGMLIEKLTWMYATCTVRGYDTFYYNFKCMRPDGTATELWDTWDQVPEASPSNYASCSMYWPTQFEMNRDILRRTVEYASRSGVGRVVPFISLGWEWELFIDPKTKKTKRVANSDIDTQYSYLMGFDLNVAWRKRYVPNGHVPYVWMWPGVAHNEMFWDHFVAYVRGALPLPKRK